MLSPIPVSQIDTDQIPSFNEMAHWSGRVSHAAMTAGVGIAVALALHFVVFTFLRRVAHKHRNETELVAAAQLYHAARWALVATALSIADNADRLLAYLWGPLARFIVPAITGWVLYALLETAAELMARHAAHSVDPITARSRRTRITILSRSMGFVIIFITVALILLSFPAVQHIGATLIASAGLIGIAVGAAAQPALKSLIAGIQIALTEPIRIGDFVVVDTERGRVEDVRLSYVVIRTIDERRLIVPTVKFLDTTFQNWTRVEGITGSVFLPIKPGFAIEPVRQAFRALLAECDNWDERTGELLVSEVRVGSVELQMMVSAPDPAALALLRNALREAMLEWLRLNMSDALCKET